MTLNIVNKVIPIFLISLSVFTCQIYAKDTLTSVHSCSVDDYNFVQNIDFSSLKKKEIDALDSAVEGSKIESYWRKGYLVSIQAVHFGETGKAELSYYFNPKNNDQYLVEVNEYYYTAPIYYSDSKIASSVKSKFVVCDNGLNFPNGGNIQDVYARAVEELNQIKKRM